MMGYTHFTREQAQPLPGQAAVPEAVAKEPWQMTQDEWAATGRRGALPSELEHRGQVFAALREGKPVPPEVLADYPDLARLWGGDQTIS